jgi:hypothetical protein
MSSAVALYLLRAVSRRFSASGRSHSITVKMAWLRLEEALRRVPALVRSAEPFSCISIASFALRTVRTWRGWGAVGDKIGHQARTTRTPR